MQGVEACIQAEPSAETIVGAGKGLSLLRLHRTASRTAPQPPTKASRMRYWYWRKTRVGNRFQQGIAVGDDRLDVDPVPREIDANRGPFVYGAHGLGDRADAVTTTHVFHFKTDHRELLKMDWRDRNCAPSYAWKVKQNG